MSRVAQFFQSFSERIAGLVRVAVLARVERYDAGTGKADIQPLQGDLPLISGAYTVEQEGQTYEKGDTVLVVFLDFPFDEPDTTESHRLEDAVVIGKVKV